MALQPIHQAEAGRAPVLCLMWVEASLPSNVEASKIGHQATIQSWSGMNLLQGTLDLLVLKALVFGPRHGYQVARWVRDTTEGTLEVDDGALYTSLHRLEKRGCLESDWRQSESNRRAKFYRLTRKGRSQLKTQTAAWASIVAAVGKVLDAAPAGGLA